MSGQVAVQFLTEYTAKSWSLVDTILAKQVESAGEFGVLPKLALQYFKDMVGEGKGIRGALVTLGYRLGGGTELEEITRVSIFIELFHSAILVQDDFMDDSDTRRGKKTLHRYFSDYAAKHNMAMESNRYGTALATCVSDSAFFLAQKWLLTAKFDRENVYTAMHTYCDYAARLAHGQILDLSAQNATFPTRDEVLKVLWLKSGEYTTLMPLKIGAALAGLTDTHKITALSKYAECLGWTFQLQDDFLGMFGDPQKVGKPVGDDLKEGKQTLLVLFVREHGTPAQNDLLTKQLGNQAVTDHEVVQVQTMLKEAGVYDYMLAEMAAYVKKGKEHIPQITSDEKLQELLGSFLDFMHERVK